MELTIAILTLVVSLVTALFVYSKNPKNGTLFYFAAMVFFISAYPIFNYLAVNSNSSEQALVWAKMILFVSIPQGPLLYFFAKTFPDSKFIFNKKRQAIIIAWVVFNIALAFFGLIFKSVSVSNKVVSIQPGPLVPSFGLLHVSTIVAGLFVLFRKYKHSSGKDRGQLAYVFYGIAISFTLTFLITFVLPIFLKNTILLAISPIFLGLSVVAVAYAIVAQRLFDIRAAVTRAVAYLLLLVTLGSVFGFIVFYLTKHIIHTDNAFLVDEVIPLITAIALASSYQPAKRFFDRMTNKYFFKDAYDTQVVLDSLGNAIVNEIDLKRILHNSRTILSDALKSSFVEVVLIRNDVVVFDTEDRSFIKTNIKELSENIKQQHLDLVVTEDMVSRDPLKEIFSVDHIALSLRLKTSQQIVGYILFGDKKSGDVYNEQDKKLLTIVANELAIAIQNASRFEEIENFNITLQKEVEDATGQLRRTNDKLKALDATKDEFISMASHQLRTPLTSVKGYMSMVLDGDAGKLNGKQKQLLDQAFISSQRMVYLIADLLNVSRLHTGKFVIERKPTQLAEVVEGELAQLKETAKAKKINLEYVKPKNFPELMLDETKTRQVIMNFADNAIHYTNNGGMIKVSLLDRGDSIEFLVSDDGIGVPKSEQHHLFTKFFRADNAKVARPDGTGLGLFMAKKVVIAQGGAIIFSSQEGKGSTFGFTFPKNDKNNVNKG